MPTPLAEGEEKKVIVLSQCKSKTLVKRSETELRNHFAARLWLLSVASRSLKCFTRLATKCSQVPSGEMFQQHFKSCPFKLSLSYVLAIAVHPNYMNEF